ncbi:hypothetical protein TTE2175 [Caldanaerobacter subterraneus subsp. tengcongensis MB4]|uniref:Uncharacterized protein n=1 Tax=Caldanaerobacter subterraneus subsp. tengcongensis (strain DSM 15242 / JCM 11007 / NBRC 100824 / MB4) TaxID=273068 RepID=Q8R854_CALS4|nr:hypothetical protein TTE2175 [Caldanaerobacter subterraneus subsp. tengcongensis MB4]
MLRHTFTYPSMSLFLSSGSSFIAFRRRSSLLSTEYFSSSSFTSEGISPVKSQSIETFNAFFSLIKAFEEGIDLLFSRSLKFPGDNPVNLLRAGIVKLFFFRAYRILSPTEFIPNPPLYLNYDISIDNFAIQIYI